LTSIFSIYFHYSTYFSSIFPISKCTTTIVRKKRGEMTSLPVTSLSVMWENRMYDTHNWKKHT
jgi:hypothetical protein